MGIIGTDNKIKKEVVAKKEGLIKRYMKRWYRARIGGKKGGRTGVVVCTALDANVCENIFPYSGVSLVELHRGASWKMEVERVKANLLP